MARACIKVVLCRPVNFNILEYSTTIVTNVPQRSLGHKSSARFVPRFIVGKGLYKGVPLCIAYRYRLVLQGSRSSASLCSLL